MKEEIMKYLFRSRISHIALAAGHTAVVLALLVRVGASQPALAQIMGDLPTIRNVALGPSASFDPKLTPFAVMTQNNLGNYSLIARLIDRKTGKPIGFDVAAALPSGITPVDMIWSHILRPGSLLVLDTDFFVHEFAVGYDVNNQITLTAPAGGVGVLGPYGDPTTDGAPTSLAEAPSFLAAIGTTTGNLILDDGSGTFTVISVARGPILDLAVAPQVGYFAVVALVPDKLTGGSKLVGVLPDSDPNAIGAQPVVSFNLLAEPRPDPILQTIAGAVFEPNDGPLADPAEVNLIAANAQGVFRVTIPADPLGSSTATVSVLDFHPITQLALGSLAMVPADGSGVLFDPGFNLNQGGISGTLLTIYGSSAEVGPATLKLSSHGNFVTAVIEVADGVAKFIEQDNIVLDVNGGFVKQSLDFAPQLGDEDKDGNADLKVKFDRASVQSLLAGQSGRVLVTLRWQFTDGSSGSTVAQVRVVE